MARPSERPIKKQKASPVPAAAPQALQLVLDADHYSNVLRERDRYQIQWFDYACKNCGVVWKADCVTISFRQTAVSQCLKGHKKCSDREEHARMQAGERYITTKHMAGNGGTDLTPSTALISAAKAAGLIVAVDPANKTPLFFKAHPTRPPPAKLPVAASAVPAAVLADV